MPTIYRKTAKGVSEIETRAFRLAPRMRSALILVDGRRSDADLSLLILQQADATLAALAEQGFIELVAPAPAASPAAAPAPAAAPPKPGPATDFVAQRGAAVRALNDQLGPVAETLAIRMERTRSSTELRPLLDTAVQLIANARGCAAAEAYAARLTGF